MNMISTATKLIIKLAEGHHLTQEEFRILLENYKDLQNDATALARQKTVERFGKGIYIRGLIEISNICKNDCYYCGLRRSNPHCRRYRLTSEDILACCQKGYTLGFRTFVLQGGEDGGFSTEELCDLVATIKQQHPDCAVTLSVGERSRSVYQQFYDAGADRYLLRHETADEQHYRQLHPENLSPKIRKQCLKDLKEIGFQVGTGFLVGSPYQTIDHLCADLMFIQDFKPHMIGIGPFIPHKDTPFGQMPAGDLDLTCFLVSLLRLGHPNALIPATTAMGTLAINGRERAILAGANVVMPNLSPPVHRKDYTLYNNKLSDGAEAAESKDVLEARLHAIGYHTVIDRGDFQSAS
ncbi:MAG: [FeFe] hydrogenase H-cluster radical SAM maturase HydE [Ruminococcaceae bacterium]|nr:[FeFe] hydrogenase H-cluster radical SAM maturase HydE [Oscillospiraceae bacterium]